MLGKRLVPAALNILDNRAITIYSNNPKTLEIAEILEQKSQLHFIRLIVPLNYCTCEYFREKVLNKKTPATGPYTCQHVLAVRLAIALQHTCLEYKEVPAHKLDLLLNYFLPEDQEVH